MRERVAIVREMLCRLFSGLFLLHLMEDNTKGKNGSREEERETKLNPEKRN
jgi:hypothetical protein